MHNFHPKIDLFTKKANLFRATLGLLRVRVSRDSRVRVRVRGRIRVIRLGLGLYKYNKKGKQVDFWVKIMPSTEIR